MSKPILDVLPCPIDDVGPKATEATITAAEAEIGLKLPAAYRKLLLSANGCELQDGVFYHPRGASYPEPVMTEVRYLMGIGQKRRERDLVAWYKSYGHRLPPYALQFSADSGGNAILVFTAGAQRGEVAFRDHEGGALKKLASSMDEFLQHLRPREAPEVLADFPLLEGQFAVKIIPAAKKKAPAAKKKAPAAAKKKAPAAAKKKAPAAARKITRKAGK